MKLFFINTIINMAGLVGLVTGGFYTDSTTIMSLLVIICMMTFVTNMEFMNSSDE